MKATYRLVKIDGVTLSEPACGDCRFFAHFEHDDGDGWCLRYPRTHPKRREQWCGEFQQRPAAISRQELDRAIRSLTPESSKPSLWQRLIARFRRRNAEVPPGGYPPLPDPLPPPPPPPTYRW